MAAKLHIVWLINPTHEKLVAMIHRILQFACTSLSNVLEEDLSLGK